MHFFPRKIFLPAVFVVVCCGIPEAEERADAKWARLFPLDSHSAEGD